MTVAPHRTGSELEVSVAFVTQDLLGKLIVSVALESDRSKDSFSIRLKFSVRSTVVDDFEKWLNLRVDIPELKVPSAELLICQGINQMQAEYLMKVVIPRFRVLSSCSLPIEEDHELKRSVLGLFDLDG